MTEKTEYNFLVISDIHENTKNLNKFIEKFKETGKNYDYLICCGDLVSTPPGEQDKKESIEKYDKMIKEILEQLETINQNILYVPGNHETRTFIDNKEDITQYSKNLHKKYLKIDDSLYIAGLGGSTPILHGNIFNPKMSPYTDLDVRNVLYDGYPYNYADDMDNFTKSDADLGNELQTVINQIKEDSKGNKIGIILLTHLGPISAWTNYELINGGNGYLGSKKLEEIFFEDETVFLDIHGHTHDSKGLIEVKDWKYILNPGYLQGGCYATIKINKSSKGYWGVTDTLFGKV